MGLISSEISLKSTAIFLYKRYERSVDLWGKCHEDVDMFFPPKTLELRT